MAKAKKKKAPAKKKVEAKKKPDVYADRKPGPRYRVGNRFRASRPQEDVIINNSPMQIRGFPHYAAFQEAGVNMGRATNVVLLWHKDPPQSLDDVNTWGWWPHTDKTNNRKAPHWAIDRDGVSVQFLDPYRNGSGCHVEGEESLTSSRLAIAPRNTIVIAQIGSGKKPTRKQLDAKNRLMDFINRQFRNPVLHDEWEV